MILDVQGDGLTDLVKKRGECFGVCECQRCLIYNDCKPAGQVNTILNNTGGFMEFRYQKAIETLTKECGKEFVVEVLL